MTEDQRAEYIGWILMWSKWSLEGLENLSDQNLIKEYDRYRVLQ